jgi:hypothetical protein
MDRKESQTNPRCFRDRKRRRRRRERRDERKNDRKCERERGDIASYLLFPSV